jgi:2,5-diamino-6-(ribosylamino)-4(3H)-pyrimidinone 5'-phosphate reductase
MKRPYVIIFSTITVDGRLASATSFSKLSCNYDLARLRLLRGAVEAVMIGASTALIDDPSLRKRLLPKTEKYYRVVVDGALRLHRGLRLFREPGPQVIVLTGSDDAGKIRQLEEAGAKVHVVGEDGVVDMKEALRVLAERYGIKSILVEGGGRLNYSLIASKVVDEIRATITPYVFGAGTSFFHDPAMKGFPTTREGPQLKLQCVEKCPCGNCVHIGLKVLDTCCEPLLERSPIEYCLSEKLREIINDKQKAQK